MKTFRLIAVSFMFAAFFAVSAFAQAQTAATGKIGLVDTSAFGGDEKGAGGITRLKTAMKSLDDEFKPITDKLRGMATQYQTLTKEIDTLQKQAQSAKTGVPVDTNSLNTKVEQAQQIEKNIKREQEDANARYERRQAEVMGPVFSDLRKAMNEFAKQKGYAIILDGAKLEQDNVLWGFDDKFNVTAEFITFYNARPAGAATATTKP